MSVEVHVAMFDAIAVTVADLELYEVPTPTTQILTNAEVQFTNKGTVAHTLNVWLLPKGASTDTTSLVWDEEVIGANENKSLKVGSLKEGGSIVAAVDAGTDVIAHAISGTLYTP